MLGSGTQGRDAVIQVLCLVLLAGGGAMDAVEIEHATVRAAVERAAGTPHPRLVLTPAIEAALRANLVHDRRAARFADHLRREAEAVLALPPPRRDQQQGRRLLGVSREVLRRLLLLGLVHRLDGDDRFLERAVVELRAVAAFADWNPSHWLDVAEMATAVAFGYDWLHADLSPADRALVVDALERHAFAVYSPNRWTNNWNDVCNGGMIVASLAIAEDRPELAAETIALAVAELPRALGEIAPEGAHPEGGAYWHYATLYSVTAIAALESAAGTDLGLVGAHPGWLASGGYYAHLEPFFVE